MCNQKSMAENLDRKYKYATNYLSREEKLSTGFGHLDRVYMRC